MKKEKYQGNEDEHGIISIQQSQLIIKHLQLNISK